MLPWMCQSSRALSAPFLNCCDAASTVTATMNLLESLERRFGRFAIPGLIRIIAGFNALVFVLARLNPEFVSLLNLDRRAVLHGQVWRLVTYIYIPTTSSRIWFLFVLLFLWFIGEGLGRAWGAFRFNLFYFVVMVSRSVAAFLF